MEVTVLLWILTYFHFAGKGTLRLNNSVQAYNSVDCQMQLILVSRERNGKTTKVADSELVLGAEFLFTTFSFDLVLTVKVFCVALHQNFGTWLFHLEIHSLYICGTPHKKIKPWLAAKPQKMFRIRNG